MMLILKWKYIISLIFITKLFSNELNRNDDEQEIKPQDEITERIESSSSPHLHHISHNGGELGDSAISDTSRDGLFASMDNDGNGKVTLEELTQYIEGTGGNSLDEQSEIQSAVSSTMSHLDDNHDNVLKKDDFSKYWSSLGSVLSVEEVTDWVAHSQLMPDAVVQSFQNNAITGYDFPELLENDGSLLESELGVTRQTTKKRLMRGMKMKLFGMGSPPPAARSPIVRLSEQTLCYTNIQIEWEAVHLNPNDKHDVYPVHLYRLQRQEQSLLSSLSQSSKWITVYEGPETNCFDKLYTPPIRTTEDNSSGISNQVVVSYRLSSWNVIGRSEYSYLKYDITRPIINSWSELYGQDECMESQFPQSHASSEFQLMILKNSELANASPVSQPHPNSSPAFSRLGVDPDPTISTPSWSIWTFFGFLFHILWLLWTIYSTGRAWVWTILSIFSIPITIIYLYMRFNPPGGDSSGSNSHWVHTTVMKPLVTSMCSLLIHGCKYLSTKLPSIKPKMQSIIHFLENVPNRDTQIPSPRGVPEPSAVKHQRALKRMNSLRSVGEDSADSQHSGTEDHTTCTDGERCYLCLKPFKLQVSFPKVKWRVKHHCSVCLNLFCSKCGVVTHANVQCPVRGTCCCQRCADAIKPRSNHHSHPPRQQEETPPPQPLSCCDHDDISTTTALTDPHEVTEIETNNKKKIRSFASLKEFGLSLGRKSDKKEKVSKFTIMETEFHATSSCSGIPPRPISNNPTKTKSLWPPIPSLGRRIISSPPSINSDRRTGCPSPPDISTSQSWPQSGYDSETISDVSNE